MMHQSFVSTAPMGSGNNGVTFPFFKNLLKAIGDNNWSEHCLNCAFFLFLDSV